MKKDQSEIFADAQRAAALNKLAKELPLNKREKVMIAVMAILALIPAVHLALIYTNLSADAVTETSAISAYSSRWILPILAVCNIIIVPAAVGKNFYTQATNLSKHYFNHSAESVIHAYRLWLNGMGIVCVALIGYALEVDIREAQGISADINGWILAGLVVLGIVGTGVYYRWLRKGSDSEGQ